MNKLGAKGNTENKVQRWKKKDNKGQLKKGLIFN